MKAQIRTKNFSSAGLKGVITSPHRTVVRLGSITPTSDVFPLGVQRGVRINEINTVDAIQNSRSKLLMKECFANAGIPQSDWFIWKESDIFINKITNEEIHISDLLIILSSGLLMKRVHGFKGNGMYYIKTMEEWGAFKSIAKSKYSHLDIT